MKHNYLLFADHAALTADGKIILVGIIARIICAQKPSKEEPVLHPSLGFAYEVLNDEDKTDVGDLSLILKHHDGDIVFQDTRKMNFTNDDGKKVENVWGVGNLTQLKFPKTGHYEFILSLDGKVIGRQPLELLEKA